MARPYMRVEARREKEHEYAQLGISSTQRNASQTFAIKHQFPLDRVQPAHPWEYKYVPSQDRAKRPAKNSQAAKRYTCSRIAFAALRRGNRRDKGRACRPDSP